ncbi:MAG: GDSL-type esterase/lipase family protein [Candidatus Omnitrophica bacterium]|nr:GDSL-type esterase/lipase family protein [Candidatus Omnitrophota bacterium]
MLKTNLKKTIFPIIFFLAILSLAGCVDTSIKNINSRGKNIICFGDSFTLGYGVEKGKDYPYILSKMFSVPVINAGIEGDVTVQALKRLDSDVLEKNPLLVVVEFGGNDFLSRVPLAETVKNMEEIIKRLQSRGVMVAVFDMSTDVVMSVYGKPYRELCKRYGAIFIPAVLEGIIIEPTLKSDFIHPNAAGYKIIAHRVYRAILPYINRNLIMKKFQEEILK